MPFAAALSEHPIAATAVGEVLGDIGERLGTSPDVAVLFATEAHLGAIEDVAATVQTVLDPRAFIGTAACAVLGGDRGVEDRPGMVLWAGRLAGRLTPVHLTAEQSDDGWVIAGLESLRDRPASTLVLIADPFTFPVGGLLATLAAERPEIRVIGGMASAARMPGGNRLIVGGRVTAHGAVGLLLDGVDAPETVVSQGCRPIGTPFTVTRSERHVIHELAGRPALERLLEMVEGLDPADRALAREGLQCGIVVDDHKLDFGRGDFLIRGVLGADRENGAIAVGDNVPVGATVQFQVRDATTAGEDLQLLLSDHDASGALVFTCNGRGVQMFGDEHHDASIVHRVLGGAVAGMFCAGEVGPVAGTNALHGFTASVALFHD
jgi:small ligand-binding sensory domain FIST